MKYRLIKYKNGSYGLHEVWRNGLYERPTSVGDTVEEIAQDILNMMRAFMEKPVKGPKKYQKMREDV